MPRVCSTCRAKLAEGEMFCGNCGAPAFCPACGHRIAKGELYCGECGRKAGTDTAETLPPPVVSKAPAEPGVRTSPPPLPPEPRPSPTASRSRWRLAFLALLMLGILGGGVFWLAQRDDEPDTGPPVPIGEPAAGLIPSVPTGTGEGVSSATPGQYTPPAPALGPAAGDAGPLHADPRELGIVFDELRQGQPGPAPGQAPPPGNSRITRVVLTRNTSDASGRKGIIFAVSFVSDPLSGGTGASAGGRQVVVHFRDANGGIPLPGQPPYADANGNLATWVPYVSPRMTDRLEDVPVFMPYDQLPADRPIEAQVALYDPATRRFITNSVSFPLDPLH